MSNQIEFFDIPNPCKRVCETDKQGYCISCNRSRDERFGWQDFSEEHKREILRLCRQRALKKRYTLYLQRKQALQLELNEGPPQLDLF